MTSSEAIADSLRRTLTGPMWHGDAVNQLLDGVSAAEAARRPVAGAHTIWELVLHMTAWAAIVERRLSSEKQLEPTTAEDWPPPVGAPGIDAWNDALKRLGDAYESLAEKSAILDRDALDVLVPGHDYTVRIMLIGVVEHGAYHGGQIGLLKRALRS